MAKRLITCSECRKPLFETDKSDGAAGAEAERLGFVFKMPFLYGVEGCFFFCCKEHQRAWFDKHVPKDPAVDESIRKAKERIPEMSADVCKKMSALQKVLNKRR